MVLDNISHLHPVILPTVVALCVMGVILAIAWPWLVPNETAKRLRDQISGASRERALRRKMAEEQQAAAQEQKGLQTKPSELLRKLIRLFRVDELLNDGAMVQMLQQAGYRGRASAVKYLAIRIISPFALLGIGLLIAGVILPPNVALIQKIAVIIGSAFLGYFLPPILLKNQIERRKIEIGRVWPDAVDLLLICVETGMSIEHAFRKVAEEMASASIELAKEMGLTNAELSYLQERRQAYENMAKRIDLEAVQAVTGCLIQSEKYGTSLGVSLRVLAQESRELRMAAAEKKAAALPPKLTVPMILFFLPVLFAVIITPAALQISAS